MQALKLRTAILALFVALMAAWVLAPSALAQGTNLDLSLTPASLPNLVPESGAGTLTATAKYTYQSGAQALSASGFGTVTVSFKPVCPPSIVVTGPTTKVMSISPTSATAGTGGGEAVAVFAVTATREAPGLKSIKCTMTAEIPTAQAPAGTNVPAPSSVDFTVSAAYYSLVAPKITKKLQQAGPQKQVPFSIELTNYGNARTAISFVQGAAPAGKRWSILMPDNLILDSPYSGGEGKTVDTATVTVATPYKNGWNNEQGAYQIIMKVASADQPDSKGNDLSANILVRVRGVYVPSLEPTLMLLALVGSALVLRMRKADE